MRDRIVRTDGASIAAMKSAENSGFGAWIVTHLTIASG
jgi:hypothetical protein